MTDYTKEQLKILLILCPKCDKYGYTTRHWFDFAMKCEGYVKCVDCLFPGWKYLRSPRREKQ